MIGERGVYRDFFTKVVRLKFRLLARAAENDVHRDFFTMDVRLKLKFPGRGQRETLVEILQNQLAGSASDSLGLSSGAAGLLVDVFNDVCAGGRRPARRTATLSVRKLVWVNTSSDRSGHMARSSLRRRLACP